MILCRSCVHEGCCRCPKKAPRAVSWLDRVGFLCKMSANLCLEFVLVSALPTAADGSAMHRNDTGDVDGRRLQFLSSFFLFGL